MRFFQKKWVFFATPVVALLLLWLTRPFWLWLSLWMPRCLFHMVTGWYCPGCGNTRSVRALLRGDLFTSLRYNIIPVVTIVLAALAYGEWGCYLFGHPRHLLSRRPVVIIPLCVLLAAYFVLRNVWEFMPA